MNTRIGALELRSTEFTVSTANFSTRVHTVIFDLDGVLVDSHPQIDQALRQWAHDRSIDLTRWWREAHALTDPEFITLAAPHLDVGSETDALRAIEFTLAATTRCHPGAQETYGSLPSRLRCIVTSGSRATVLRRIRAAGLPDPAVLVAAEDVRHGKPHPEPYLTALDRFGISPADAIVIEDSPAGAQSAHAAGLPVIGVARPDSPARTELMAESLADCLPNLSGLAITPRRAP